MRILQVRRGGDFDVLVLLDVTLHVDRNIIDNLSQILEGRDTPVHVTRAAKPR